MKSVLMSIAPKWCELIANGEKTIDVRKTKPKIETPFKCYIYCTKEKYKNKYLHTSNKKNRLLFWHNKGDCEIVCQPENTSYIAHSCFGKVIGEFVCDEISKFTAEFTDGKTYEDIRYHYFDEFEDEQEMIVVSNEWENPNNSWICKESCLSFNDFKKYIGENFHDIPFYTWHISDLKIYDEPKELASFKVEDKHRIERCAARERVYNNPDFTNGAFLKGTYYCNKYNDFCDKCLTKELTQPPKSWCYVESVIG